MLRKKRCCKRFFFALIGKDIQKDFKKICELLEFGLRSVSGERDHWKEPSKYLETLRANMEWKDNMQSRAEGKISQKQTTWKERIKKGQTAKE